MNTWVWRAYLSPHVTESLNEIRFEWTTGDLAMAHRVLDMLDIEARAADDRAASGGSTDFHAPI